MAAGTACLGACSGPLSTLEPAGPAAGSLASLWWTMLAGGTVLFSLVMGLFALAVLRPERLRAISPAGWIVGGGLVLPALVLPPLVGWALVKGERLLPFPGQSVETIEAEGHQFGWRFRYPDRGGVETVDVLHLPAGAPVDVVITSADVIHSFWVPRLAGKLDAIPGQVNVQRLIAAAPGRYNGACAEFCGLEHAHMYFTVEAHAPEDYAAALAALAEPSQ
jgi:cytochrome c oxidase subunit 2